MNDLDFQKFLVDRKVVIVHFSHFALMGHSVQFPDDLLHAISHHNEETRSCCALWPGHDMELPGSVGVIFKPTIDQVISVLADDSGSSDFGGTERSAGEIPTPEALLASLQVPSGCYNEWRVRGADPIGIFVADAHNICAKKKVELNLNGESIYEIGCTEITLESVLEVFPELPVYTLQPTGLFMISGNVV
ncbi:MULTISPECIES: hypothetical protein [Stenotrophomonas]|uniref:hypothetical protein n=1 Tax=Stenotrophomonas TaxID=40323 RepID=UPI002096DEEB|nr:MULTISPECIES: hypothetical protein [Stenotrophomonas]MCO7461475.1 hypothetical protein [Stenotrophomonas maltophilia]MCR8716797.1 hypothetical protein [Stenotrophomonas indicatrix]